MDESACDVIGCTWKGKVVYCYDCYHYYCPEHYAEHEESCLDEFISKEEDYWYGGD